MLIPWIISEWLPACTAQGRTLGSRFLAWLAQPFTWQLWQCGESFICVPGVSVGMQSPEHPSHLDPCRKRQHPCPGMGTEGGTGTACPRGWLLSGDRQACPGMGTEGGGRGTTGLRGWLPPGDKQACPARARARAEPLAHTHTCAHTHMCTLGSAPRAGARPTRVCWAWPGRQLPASSPAP